MNAHSKESIEMGDVYFLPEICTNYSAYILRQSEELVIIRSKITEDVYSGVVVDSVFYTRLGTTQYYSGLYLTHECEKLMIAPYANSNKPVICRCSIGDLIISGCKCGGV